LIPPKREKKSLALGALQDWKNVDQSEKGKEEKTILLKTWWCLFLPKESTIVLRGQLKGVECQPGKRDVELPFRTGCVEEVWEGRG